MKAFYTLLILLIPFVGFGQIINKLGGDIDGEAAGDYSDYSVSLSSDGMTVSIGERYNDGNGDNSGHVRVYSCY